jgi:hypothetical protein
MPIVFVRVPARDLIDGEPFDLFFQPGRQVFLSVFPVPDPLSDGPGTEALTPNTA